MKGARSNPKSLVFRSHSVEQNQHDHRSGRAAPCVRDQPPHEYIGGNGGRSDREKDTCRLAARGFMDMTMLPGGEVVQVN